MEKQADIKQDQAEELRHLVGEIEGNKEVKEELSASLEEIPKKREIDILNLPPRKEVHTISNRTRFRISRPFIRIIFVVIVLIVILIVGYYFIPN
ncbi:hypothetical protein CWR48_08575 [Oceanobacillus arenosus]|uniref:Uncharacterized protein n=1 Tax=Oceanobacillus arenosus TaxID=1229153 RepID=A0A3D8PSZ4_9BACI|nr:hypothetical protein [Oceanobacillus arenosus]RDW19094.1 hypothetical protein CWR48_08575 [Oceanobacillus arenosus]